MLNYADECRSYDAISELVAEFADHRHRIELLRLVLRHEDSLVLVWIELFAHRIDLRQAVSVREETKKSSLHLVAAFVINDAPPNERF